MNFTEGGSRAPREETISEPGSDEAILLEEFLTVGLRVPRTKFSWIYC
jgi:hypothetical protein